MLQASQHQKFIMPYQQKKQVGFAKHVILDFACIILKYLRWFFLKLAWVAIYESLKNLHFCRACKVVGWHHVQFHGLGHHTIVPHVPVLSSGASTVEVVSAAKLLSNTQRPRHRQRGDICFHQKVGIQSRRPGRSISSHVVVSFYDRIRQYH